MKIVKMNGKCIKYICQFFAGRTHGSKGSAEMNAEMNLFFFN